MHTIKLLACGPLLLLATAASAQTESVTPRTEGVSSIGLGGGTGIYGLSGSHWLSDTASINVVAGPWLTYSNLGGGVEVDYLSQMPTLSETRNVVLGWHAGGGVAMGIQTGLGAAAGITGAGIAGVNVHFRPTPVELVVEYRPGVQIAPSFRILWYSATTHLRIYF